MKIWVKALAFILVLVMLTATFASCMPRKETNNSTPNNGTTNNGSTNQPGEVIPPEGGDNVDNGGNTVGTVVVGNATAPYLADVYVSADVTPDEENKVPAEGVNLDSSLASAVVPGGVQMTEGATELALTINNVKESQAEIALSASEISSSLDVHVNGVAASNAIPMEIKLVAAALKGLNSTSIKLYHVENGETIEMTYVPSDAEFTAHNQFKYDPATGDITLYIASFSEIAIVSDTTNAWEGGVDHTWYNASATELYIASAEQLWSFSQIVGGMAEGIEQDSFKDKTVTLIADINLGDKESANNPDIIFYPIGYYNSEGTYERTNTAITSGLRNFEGTFDGNGHTISNFYQNTWEMKGDHDWYSPQEQYYRDGMGLFGRVYGATIKNLTVENFSSDGEITTTGVIAAYADGATFENIQIFNCNPRVYNIGNGGIVGCVGWYAKEVGLTTFTNITVDNTNKISALWGSYDVACGGILGQYYPTSGQTSAGEPKNGGIEFTNCHVSAIMDVYNDVCANYQYYAYRYTGMLIGSVRENETIDGHVYPKMDGIVANGCTVHFGTWNDYYYCEIIDNTTASYTHDYQMSRLTEIKAIDGTTITYLDGSTGTVPASGRANYVIVDYTKGHGTENATCYHFKDGVVWNHEDAGYHDGSDGGSIIDENGDGNPDLREDKQHIYLEFNNLVTGYGWGVTTVALTNLENVNIKDTFGITGGDVEGSDTKFEYIYDGNLEIGKTYTLAELFAATGKGAEIKNNNVVVTISTATGKADFIYNMDKTDWTQSTLKLNNLGDVTITISDYYFCKSTTVTVNVDKADKFESAVFDDILYRVGNMNAVTLAQLFKLKAGFEDPTNVNISISNGSYTAGTGDWKAGTLNFSSYTGIVEITIKETINGIDYSYPCTIKVEIVDGKNILPGSTLEGATANNIVLHCNIGSGFTVSGRYTFYGNGFTLNYTGNGQYLNNGLKQGLVTVSENGTIDNLRIVMPVYPKAYMYYGYSALGDYVQGAADDEKSVETSGTTTKTRYHYQLSAVLAKGNATISNCYIYGGRNNIFVDTGDVTIKDSILECGTVANVQIQSNSSHTITIEDVTTIQYRVNATIGDTTQVMLGAGVLVGPETNSNPTIVLNGDFKQYNWVNSDDKDNVSGETAEMIISGALDTVEYNHTINGKTASNLGIIYMNEYSVSVINNTGLPYAEKTVTMKVGLNSANGKAYSLQEATEDQIYWDYTKADKTTVNSYYIPQFRYPTDLGGQLVENTDGCDEYLYRDSDTIYVMFVSGDTKEVDLGALVNITKYTGQDLGAVVSVVDSKGDTVTVTDGKITLSAADTYTATYEVTDTVFYDKDGNAITKTVNYSWNVEISVSLKDKATPNAEFVFDTSKQIMGYGKKSGLEGLGKNNFQYIPFLAGLQIYDYIGQEKYLRFDGNTEFSKIAKVELTCASDNAYITVTLIDGGVIDITFFGRADSGGSTKTGAIKVSDNVVYYLTDGDTSATNTTWTIDSYSFTGNNGVTIENTSQVFNNCASGTLPSGSFGTTINYTVSYDANSGNCGQTTGYATSVSSAVTLPTPSRSGYVFAGWFTAASGGTKVGDAGASYTPSANITLYAQWAKLGSVVTYNANGGSCGTTNAIFEGTTLTLPTPTRDGYWFIGWYDAAEDGNKIGDAGATYNPIANITLYAHWQEQIKYTVTYNANGGSCGTTSATYEGTALTLPTPTRTGYTFNGWYTAASGGTKIGDADTTYAPSANITLYAQWTVNSYTITYTNSNTSSVTGPETATYGSTVTVTVVYTNGQSSVSATGNSSGSKISVTSSGSSKNYTYTFTMPAENVTMTITGSSSCVTGDTLITLADGTQKEIQYVTYEDMLLAWNHFTGKYEAVPAAIIFNHGYDYNTVIKLNFSDGTQVKAINLHQFFDADLNKYVSIDSASVNDYVGHNFVKQSGDSYTTVTLTSYEISQEYIEAYGIISALHYNILVEGMFSTDFMLKDYNLFNYFAFGEGVMFDKEMMQSDIEKYGLYAYEDFADHLTYEQFIGFNVQYFKIAVEKGLYTYEGILDLIDEYLNK